ncbi:hypothetical protein ACV3UV_11640 [Clostridium perfringens]|nr:hypothetical protein [Clostridium perfringens]
MRKIGKKKDYKKDAFDNKSTEDKAREILNFTRKLYPFGQTIQNEVMYNLNLAGEYTPQQINQMINNPKSYQQELRDISQNLMGTSPQYQNLVEAIPRMCLFRSVIIPIPNKDGKEFKVDDVKKAYIKASNKLLKMNIEEEFLKATLQMSKYDIFYGYEVESTKNYFIKALNPKYCKITSFDSCLNFAFDFSYFMGREDLLKTSYPKEFTNKYVIYKNSGYNADYQWQELDPYKSICVKWFNDELDYCLPPYVSLFDDLYNLKDYKGLNKDKVKADLLKMLVFKIPLNKKGEKPDDFLLSLNMIQTYMELLNEQLPDSVAAVTTPMDAEEVKFQTQGVAKEDEILKAEKLLFSSSAFAPALFGVDATGSALEYSTKYNLGKCFSLYRQFETWLNRKFNKLYGGKIYIQLLDITTFNEKEVQDRYLQGSQMSAPCKTLYTASLGLQPATIMGLNFLENEILKTHETWKPLNSSHTQNGNEDKGRPRKDTGDLTDAGETTRVRDDNNKK